jgi:hypothetical protein
MFKVPEDYVAKSTTDALRHRTLSVTVLSSLDSL